MLYPEGDPRRGRTIDAQIEELGTLTVESLASFHREFLGADGVVGGVVGDIGDANVTALFEPLFREWKARKPGILAKNDAVEELQSMAAKARTPGKPNAISALIQPIRLSQASPDYVALDAAASALFQDQLASRIPKKIRGEKALSYAAGGQIVGDPRGDFGLVILFAMTKPENSDRVMGIFKTELAEALKSGVTADELEAYKKAYANRTAQARSNDGTLAATIVSFKLADRGFAFWTQLDEAAGRLTLDDVNAALRKYVDPEKMGLLQVGDFAEKPEKP
jgi:zinc protease